MGFFKYYVFLNVNSLTVRFCWQLGIKDIAINKSFFSFFNGNDLQFK